MFHCHLVSCRVNQLPAVLVSLGIQNKLVRYLPHKACIDSCNAKLRNISPTSMSPMKVPDSTAGGVIPRSELKGKEPKYNHT